MKQKWVMLMLLAGILSITGCGSTEKETLKETETKDEAAGGEQSEENTGYWSDGKESDDSAAEAASWNIPSENIHDYFDGTIVLDGITLTIPCHIGTMENKEELLLQIEEWEQSAAVFPPAEFYYDDDTLPLEDRIIIDVEITAVSGEPAPVSLPDGTSLLRSSRKDLYETFGTADFYELLPDIDAEFWAAGYEYNTGSLTYQMENVYDAAGESIVEESFVSLSISADDDAVEALRKANSVSASAPAVDAKWQNGSFAINGKTYTMDSTIDDFLANNWTVHPKQEGTFNRKVLEPGETDSADSYVLYLDKKSVYIRVTGVNCSDEPKALKDCNIHKVTIIFSGLPFSLSGGITETSALDDLLAAYGEPADIVDMDGTEDAYGSFYPTFDWYSYETEGITLGVFVNQDKEVCGFRYTRLE